jgi:hypothetical protein
MGAGNAKEEWPSGKTSGIIFWSIGSDNRIGSDTI